MHRNEGIVRHPDHTWSASTPTCLLVEYGPCTAPSSVTDWHPLSVIRHDRYSRYAHYADKLGRQATFALRMARTMLDLFVANWPFSLLLMHQEN